MRREVAALVGAGALGAAAAAGWWWRSDGVNQQLDALRAELVEPPPEARRPPRPGAPSRNCVTGDLLPKELAGWTAPDHLDADELRARMSRIGRVLDVTSCRRIGPSNLDADERQKLNEVAAFTHAIIRHQQETGHGLAAQRWALDLWTLGEDLQEAHDTADYAQGLGITDVAVDALATLLEDPSQPPGAAYLAMHEARLLTGRGPTLRDIAEREAYRIRQDALAHPPAPPAELVEALDAHRRYLDTAFDTDPASWRAEVDAGPALAAVWTPPLDRLIPLEEAVTTRARQVFVLAAVRDHRERHGSCPATLADTIVPPVEQLPDDPVTARPFALSGCSVRSSHADWTVPPVARADLPPPTPLQLPAPP